MRFISIMCYVISILGFLLFGYNYFKKVNNQHKQNTYKQLTNYKQAIDSKKDPKLINKILANEELETNNLKSTPLTNEQAEYTEEEIKDLLQDALKNGFEVDTVYKNKDTSIKIKEQIDTQKSVTTYINKTFITDDGKEVHIESIEQTPAEKKTQIEGNTDTAEKIKAWQILLNHYDTDENIYKLCDNLNKTNQNLGLKLLGQISTEIDITTVKRINKCLNTHAMDSNNFYEFINSFLQGSNSEGFNLLKTIVCEQSARLDDRILSQNLNLNLIKMSQIDKLFLSYLFKCDLSPSEFSNQSDTDQCVAIFPTTKATYCSSVVLN